MLGPRVNAGGRIGAADLGARLLATDDPHEAAALAAAPARAERRAPRDRGRGCARDAEAQAAARGADGALVWAAGAGWHPGVVGIVAARLKETFGRPAVVIGFDGAEGKGSGRSVAGVDLGAAVARLAREGLIARGGGHRMAAGLSLAPRRSSTRDGPARRAPRRRRRRGRDPARSLRLDGVLAPGAATPELADRIAAAGPYGAGSPGAAPRGRRRRIAGAAPRRRRATSPSRSPTAAGGRLDAVAFRAVETPLGAFLAARVGAPLHLAGRLERDDWAGRVRVKLHVEDAAPALG